MLRSEDNKENCEVCGHKKLLDKEQLDLLRKKNGKNKAKTEPIYEQIEETGTKNQTNTLSELTDEILKTEKDLADQKIILRPSSLDSAIQDLKSTGGLSFNDISILNLNPRITQAGQGFSGNIYPDYTEPIVHEPQRMANNDDLKELTGLQRSVGLFKGENEDDIEGYFRKIERWFALCNWDAGKKAKALSILLDAKAAHFYETLDAATRNDYAQTKDILIKTFRINQSHLMRWNNINRLQMQRGQSVGDFYHQLRKQATKIEGISDMNLLNIFLNGLPNKICEKVAEQAPADLASALEKAKLIESVQINKEADSAVGDQNSAKESQRQNWVKTLEGMKSEEQKQIEILKKELKKSNEQQQEMINRIESKLANLQTNPPTPNADPTNTSQSQMNPHPTYNPTRDPQPLFLGQSHYPTHPNTTHIPQELIPQNQRNNRPMMALVGLMLRNSFTINGFQQLTYTLLREWF